MKMYINNIEKSKDYYIQLSLEYASLFEKDIDFFLFVNCVIDRAVNINRGFISLTKDDNYACAIPLMRMMIDNCIRLWGITLVDDAHKYIKVWSNGEKIANLKDRNGKRLTDFYMSQQFSLLYSDIDIIYKDACGFVHLSEQNLYMTAKRGVGKRKVELTVDGNDNLPNEVKCNIDKWMLYLNNILVDLIRRIFPIKPLVRLDLQSSRGGI